MNVYTIGYETLNHEKLKKLNETLLPTTYNNKDVKNMF